jgi:hypothetical protein
VGRRGASRLNYQSHAGVSPLVVRSPVRTPVRRVDKAMHWVAGAGALQKAIPSSRHRDRRARFAATRRRSDQWPKDQRRRDRRLERSRQAIRLLPQKFATETTNLNTDESPTIRHGPFGKRLQLRRTLGIEQAWRRRICPPQPATFTNCQALLFVKDLSNT